MEIQSDAGDASTLALNSIDTDGSILGLYKAGTLVGSIGSSSGYMVIGSPVGTDAHLLIGNGLIHPATSTGSAKDNAIDIGGSSNRFKNLYLSGSVTAGGLDVNSTTSGAVNIQVGNAAGDIALGIGSPSTANKVVVTAGGSVGIGTTPNEALHVYSAAANVLANFESGDAKAFISFKDNSTTNTDTVFLGADGNNMAFYAGSASSERMRIDASGKFIGG